MDAVKFLKVLDKMCDGKCRECEFGEKASRNEPCHYWRNAHAEEAVAIVERWTAAHPAKTRQSELLKHFPEAALTQDGALKICPVTVSAAYRDKNGLCADPTEKCDDCCRKFWLAEVEE